MIRFLVFALLFSGVAQAQALNICNQTGQSMQIALAAEVRGEISSMGWISLSNGDCSSDLRQRIEHEGLDPRRVTNLWFHARDRVSRPSQAYGQGRELCVDDLFDDFFADFADSTCEKRGYVRAAFDEVDLSRASENEPYVLESQGFF